MSATTPQEPGLLAPFEDVGDQFVKILPKAAIVLAVLLIGIIFAFLLRRATRWLVRKTGLETFGERIGAARVLYAIGARGSVAHLLGTVVFVGVLLVTASVIAEILSLPGLAEGVAALTGFLPRLLAAAVIVMAGMFFADLVRTLVLRAGERRSEDALESPRLVARLLYYTVLTVTIAMALGQVGLETSLINILIAVAAAAVLFSLGLTFALGARDAIKNQIARHYLKSTCSPGDELALGRLRGTVVRFTSTAVVLRADDGAELVIPCALSLQRAVRITRPIPEVQREPTGAGTDGELAPRDGGES